MLTASTSSFFWSIQNGTLYELVGCITFPLLLSYPQRFLTLLAAGK